MVFHPALRVPVAGRRLGLGIDLDERVVGDGRGALGELEPATAVAVDVEVGGRGDIRIRRPVLLHDLFVDLAVGLRQHDGRRRRRSVVREATTDPDPHRSMVRRATRRAR